MRQIVLDTETTGLKPSEGHRVIEIGCVELVNRRLTGNNFHYYINPQRQVEQEALKVHGITNEFLLDKPVFKDILPELIEFIKDAELIIHNAVFDIGFLDHEIKLAKLNFKKTVTYCKVFDTLTLARKLHPGQRNNLDALCKRYKIDNSGRDLHGALLDAQILADVYLAMTGGQKSFFDDELTQQHNSIQEVSLTIQNSLQNPTSIIHASEDEDKAHQEFIQLINQQSKNGALWQMQKSEEVV